MRPCNINLPFQSRQTSWGLQTKVLWHGATERASESLGPQYGYQDSKLKSPVDLYLNFEKTSWKNQVAQTGFLTCKNQFQN